MTSNNRLTKLQNEMNFTIELWKLVLEIEEIVRNHYLKLAEREIYELDEEDNQPF